MEIFRRIGQLPLLKQVLVSVRCSYARTDISSLTTMLSTIWQPNTSEWNQYTRVHLMKCIQLAKSRRKRTKTISTRHLITFSLKTTMPMAVLSASLHKRKRWRMKIKVHFAPARLCSKHNALDIIYSDLITHTIRKHVRQCFFHP